MFETLGEDELVDPLVPPERLLYRLFHEDGVRLFTPAPLRAFCRCSRDRVESVLASSRPRIGPTWSRRTALIRVTCEYCSRTYEIEPEAIER